MHVPEKVLDFLRQVKDISLGYSEINFFTPKSLQAAQTGYSIDPKGISLTTGKPGDWQKNWLVIANDNMGDPIIVDIAQPHFPVLAAMHGQGDWEPDIIADTLDNFRIIILKLQALSAGRENPREAEANPISKKEQKELLKEIKKQNPSAVKYFWKVFIVNE